MNRSEKKLVRSGMLKTVKAYHKLGTPPKTDLDPAIKEAFDFLNESILDLKEALGYKRNGDWEKQLDGSSVG